MTNVRIFSWTAAIRLTYFAYITSTSFKLKLKLVIGTFFRIYYNESSKYQKITTSTIPVYFNSRLNKVAENGMARWTKFPVNFSCYRARFATKIARDARFSVNICVRQEWNSRANISRVSTCRRCQEICLFFHFRGRRDKFETNTRNANSPALRSGSCLVKRAPIGLRWRYSICCLISLFIAINRES